MFEQIVKYCIKCCLANSVPYVCQICDQFSSGSCDHVHQCLVQHPIGAKRADSTCNLDSRKSHPRLHRPPPLRVHPRQHEEAGQEDEHRIKSGGEKPIWFRLHISPCTSLTLCNLSLCLRYYCLCLKLLLLFLNSLCLLCQSYLKTYEKCWFDFDSIYIYYVHFYHFQRVWCKM